MDEMRGLNVLDPSERESYIFKVEVTSWDPILFPRFQTLTGERSHQSGTWKQLLKTTYKSTLCNLLWSVHTLAGAFYSNWFNYDQSANAQQLAELRHL